MNQPEKQMATVTETKMPPMTIILQGSVGIEMVWLRSNCTEVGSDGQPRELTRSTTWTTHGLYQALYDLTKKILKHKTKKNLIHDEIKFKRLLSEKKSKSSRTFPFA